MTRNRGGRPAQISREKILEAAAELPPDDLSMSAVAARLGVTHASLYNYFPSRAALVAAVMMDHGERMEVPDPTALPWDEWVVAAGFACRSHLERHLAVTRLLRSSGLDAVMGPLMHAFVEVMSREGFSSLDTADAWNLFRGACLGAASDTQRVAAILADPALMHVWNEVGTRFAESAAPATLRWMDDIAQDLDLDASFRRQLETLVRAWGSARPGGLAPDAKTRKQQPARKARPRALSRPDP